MGKALSGRAGAAGFPPQHWEPEPGEISSCKEEPAWLQLRPGWEKGLQRQGRMEDAGACLGVLHGVLGTQPGLMALMRGAPRREPSPGVSFPGTHEVHVAAPHAR